ncbi:MAG TPA: hypothetical protein DCS93_33885 [Microscillaceae bacterium]|nr:hypothetical protein [Microscillaceae bacterium]
MKKVTFFIIGLLCYASMSMGQVVEAKRNAANKLWTDYGRNASNPSQMPATIPTPAGNAAYDIERIEPTYAALKAAMQKLVLNSGGMIIFKRSGVINFPASSASNPISHIGLVEHFPTRNLVKTIVIQGKGVTFDGKNRSGLFRIRGNLRVVFQDAVFRNAVLKREQVLEVWKVRNDKGQLVPLKRVGGAAIEMGQIGSNFSSLRVRNCQFLNNNIPHFQGMNENQNGAAIRLNNFTNGEIFGCTFKNNRAVTGGAIGCTSINKITIINSKFDGNVSNGYVAKNGSINVTEGAGALRVDRTVKPIEVYGTTFENNASNQKASVVQVFIRPAPEGSQAYPKNGPALIIDNCVFRKNKFNNYAGVSNYKKEFFIGCLFFQSSGINNNFRGGKMKLTNTVFDQNEAEKANVLLINNFEIANCTFANTKFLNSGSAAQQGTVFLQLVHDSGSFKNCTFYKNEPLNGNVASDIMFWGGDIPGKVSLNNSIFYRTNKSSAKQVKAPLKGGNNNQYIPGVAASALSKVANGAVNTTNPNIRPNNITNMCLGNNSLAKGFGGLPDCGSGGNNGGGNNGGGNSSQVIANGTYYFGSVTNNQRMYDAGNTVKRAKMANPSNHNNQQWIISHLGNNVYTVKNKATGEFLEVSNAICKDGARVSTWRHANADHMKWAIEKHGNLYELKPIYCLTRALDRDFGNTTRSGNVHLYNDVNNQNQRWAITKVSNARITQTEITFDQELIVYPNPTTDLLQVKGVKAGNEIVIRDQLGQVVFRTILQANGESLPVYHLTKGVYFISVKGKTLRIVKR